MNRNALTCQELVELVTDYLEGNLPPAEKSRFEDHISLCDGCKTYVQQIQQTIQLLGKVTQDQISEDAKGKLLEVFDKWKTDSN